MKNKTLRLTLIILGWMFVGIGFVGIFLPILPTTPFLLLAAACFSRSSERFHQWLITNRFFGPIIKDWEENRAMEKNVKIRALILVAITFGISIAVVPTQNLRIMLLCFWFMCTFFIGRIPVIER